MPTGNICLNIIKYHQIFSISQICETEPPLEQSQVEIILFFFSPISSPAFTQGLPVVFLFSVTLAKYLRGQHNGSKI